MTPSEEQLNSIIRQYGDAANNLASSHSKAANTVTTASEALKGLSDITKSTVKAFTDGSTEFSKFNDAVESMGNAARGMIGKSTATRYALSSITSILEGLVKTVFGNADKMIKNIDSLSDYGVSIGYNTKQIKDLATQAGYVVNNSQDFVKLIEQSNKSLLSLAPDTSQATSRLANIFNNTGDQLEFLRLGIVPKNLNKMQVDYIKLQELGGIKVSKDDAEVRETSLQYVRSITKLTDLTGEDRDKLAAKMAEQRRDVRYSMKLRELQVSGNKEAIDAFDKSTTLIATELNDDLAAGLRDFIANGTATTAQGEALMFMTQGKIAKWVEQVERGEITGTELAKRIAQATSSFTSTHEDALKTSGEFQRKMFMTGKTLEGQSKLATAKSEKELDDIYLKNKKKVDLVKLTQNDQLNAERQIGRARDAILDSITSYVLPAFTGFVALVRQLGYGVAKLASVLPGGAAMKDEFEKIAALLGDKEATRDLVNSTEKELSEVQKKIQEIDRPDNDIAKQEKELQEKLKKQAEIAAREKLEPYKDVEKDKREQNLKDVQKYQADLNRLNEKEKTQSLTLQEKQERDAAKLRLAAATNQREELEQREKERKQNKELLDANAKVIDQYKVELEQLRLKEKTKQLTQPEKERQLIIQREVDTATKKNIELEEKEKQRLETLRIINKTEQLHIEEDIRNQRKLIEQSKENKEQLIQRRQELLEKRDELLKEYKRKEDEERLQKLEKKMRDQMSAPATDRYGPVSSTLYSGLNFKDIKENTGGGPASPMLVDLARKLQEIYPGFTITAMDDIYHRRNRPDSAHTRGVAMDFKIDPPPRNALEAARVKQAVQDLAPGSNVLDEYFANRTENTTGGHFHVQIPKYAKGGIATGPMSGYKVELHGTEAIIPMLPNKTIPISVKSRENDIVDFKSILQDVMGKIKPQTKKSKTKQSKNDNINELIYVMADKFDEMSKKVESSTHIQQDLKLYLHS